MITYSENDLVVEPSRVHYLHFVKSINIANTGRTVALPPVGCYTDDRYQTVDRSDEVIPYEENITGKVLFKEGYNCQLYQEARAIVINAMAGYGATLNEPQNSEIPLFDDETHPDNSPFLAGGIPCEDTVKAVNGINQKAIPIMAGPGVDIRVEDNNIIVGLVNSQFQEGCDSGVGV